MIPVKGGDLLLEAAHRTPEPKPTFAMIGFGEQEANLRRQTSELELDGTVRFYPEISNAGQLFAAFDAFVLSSRTEGLPIVLLEAMAAGTPIVATRVGGVPEVLADDEAWMVPPDDPDALALAIGEALGDRVEAGARADRARARLEREFALEPWLERYEAVYRNLLNQRPD
jgi:glycosyltransferase involved in cell wall biosynthesis